MKRYQIVKWLMTMAAVLLLPAMYLVPALAERRETAAAASAGATRFCFGLAKKVLLADALGQIADGAFAAGDQLTVGLAWLGAIA